MGTVLGTIFLLSVVAPGLARGQSSTGGRYDAARLLEIRPAGGKVVGTGADLMPPSILERVRNVPHVVRAEGYLFVGVMDKTKQTSFAVIGGTVPGAAFRVNCHNVDAVRIVEGRGLEAQDGGRMIAIVGRRYAETFAPAGQSQIPVYTLSLREATGQPVTSAKVTLMGRMPDGMTVLAPLRGTREGGIYSGRVLFTMGGQWRLTVRITLTGKPLELSFTEQVGR